VRRARRLAHRRETPIILISLEDCADDARLAGADAFLRKPNNLIELVDTIRRLLAPSLKY
jgi:DNA-binding response OmpR family regulator